MTNTPEKWAPIPGASRYKISNHGRVLSFRVSKHGREIKHRPNYDGYASVVYTNDDGRRVTRFVHRLVAEIFLPRPASNTHLVRHLDSDRSNPHVDNLAWGTDSQSVRDSVKAGTHAQSRKTHCPKGHPYSGDNLIQRPYGRFCRECQKDAQARLRSSPSILADLDRVFSHYGPSCSRCDSTESLMLVAVDGQSVRSLYGMPKGTPRYLLARALIRDGFPSYVTVVCPSCYARKN